MKFPIAFKTALQGIDTNLTSCLTLVSSIDTIQLDATQSLLTIPQLQAINAQAQQAKDIVSQISDASVRVKNLLATMQTG